MNCRPKFHYEARPFESVIAALLGLAARLDSVECMGCVIDGVKHFACLGWLIDASIVSRLTNYASGKTNYLIFFTNQRQRVRKQIGLAEAVVTGEPFGSQSMHARIA